MRRTMTDFPRKRPTHLYSLFGLTVRSEIELPELHAAVGEADVDIRFGDLGPARSTVQELAMTEAGAVLHVPDIARYGIEQGCRILVDPVEGASPRNVRLFLLGSAFGALLHQRGLMPLHANAVVVGGRAIAFTGASGAGKSTMASLFHDRGYPLLSDDVCVIGFDQTRRPVAHPGIPHMRLWRDSLERSGRTTEGYERALDGRDKYNVPARRGAAPAGMPLGAIFVLKRAEEAQRVAIRRLRGAEALNAVLANTYRGRYIALLGDTQRHWSASVELVGKVAVLELERPWSPDWFDPTLDALHAYLDADAD
jgi:hypothetical protein